jgi:hypothetical protein
MPSTGQGNGRKRHQPGNMAAFNAYQRIVSGWRVSTTPTSLSKVILALWRGSFLLLLLPGTYAFPGANYTYMPPMNAILDRIPCPALNTLANHGFLPRDGRAVEVEELYQVLEDVYGMVRPVFFILGAQFRGVPFATAADGSQSFNLVDLYALDHDASYVTADSFFESMADPDDSLLDDLLAAAGDDGLLTWEEAAAARAVRILDSRRRNPQAVLTFTPVIAGIC